MLLKELKEIIDQLIEENEMNGLKKVVVEYEIFYDRDNNYECRDATIERVEAVNNQISLVV